jgi:hypothetical protein
MINRWLVVLLIMGAFLVALYPAQQYLIAEPAEPRRPASDAELRYWLENMARHRFSIREIEAATGLSEDEIVSAHRRLGAEPSSRKPGDPLMVLPYPGGRHPRIGFLDGAIQPQRDTKISVFTPWDEASYVVVDVPEAIWWDRSEKRELLYLAHTHIDTVWTRQGIDLPQQEWTRHEDGRLEMERRLPNGIVFGSSVHAADDSVRMEMWLTNGTDQKLTGLSVQNCVMLAGAPELAEQTADNKVAEGAYMAGRSAGGDHWVITAWEPNWRTWDNKDCPCLHSDPVFPDCPPGETVRLKGWLSFYEGEDVMAEFRRIDASGWDRED